MLFSFFAKVDSHLALFDEDKILIIIKKYQEAIKYLEQSIVDELCAYAKKTNNDNLIYNLNHFHELNHLLNIAPYLCKENAIIQSYKKRDIILDQLAHLIGHDPEDYKGPDKTSHLPKAINSDLNKTIGGYRRHTLKLIDNDKDPTYNSTMRTPEKTLELQKNVNTVLNNQNAPIKKSTYIRIQNAKFHFIDNEEDLKRIRDTSKVDSFLLSIVRQIGRLFSSTSHVSSMLQEVTPLLQADTPSDSNYTSLKCGNHS